ncbi:J domain-containing protein [Acinetobacter baumannii]
MNLYEILHISQDAPEEIIKLAYKGLAQKYYPDRYNGNDANEIMIKIREAYETLIDPIKRKSYDQFLAEQTRRKQQQEEYIKKKEQEEFIRAQRAAFEQQNRSYNANPSKEPNQSSKNIKIDISIDVPQNFSLFLPFIKFKHWIIDNKENFKNLGMVLIGSVILLTLVVMMLDNLGRSSTDSISQNNYDQAVETDLPDDGSILLTEEPEPEPELEPESESVNIPSTYIDSPLNSEVTNLPAINSVDIRNAANQVLKISEESGLIGLKAYIQNCYSLSTQDKQHCLYFDIASKYYHDAGAQAGFPAEDFFNSSIIFERIIQNYYDSYQVSSEVIGQHLEDALKETNSTMHGLLMEKYS